MLAQDHKACVQPLTLVWLPHEVLEMLVVGGGGGGGGANDGGRGGGANDAWEGSRPRARPWTWECYRTSRCKSTPPAPYPDRLVLAPLTASLKCHTVTNTFSGTHNEPQRPNLGGSGVGVHRNKTFTGEMTPRTNPNAHF